MSNPANILNEFQTYSYHQTIVMCDGIKTAKRLSNITDLSIFARDSKESVGLDKYEPRFINGDESAQYVILVDGAIDVDFSLKSVQWETIIAPPATTKGVQGGNTIEVDGMIEIVEPYGIRLYEVLANAVRDMGVDSSTVVFLLKTIFTGHTDTGETKTINDVKPFLFVMTDLTSQSDSVGTTYKIEIVGTANGSAKLPQIAKAAEGISIGIVTGSSVHDAIKAFETAIKEKYEKFKAELFQSLRQAGDNSEEDIQALIDRFQDVEYEFRTDPAYQDASVYPAGTTKNSLTDHENGTKCIASSANSTIESFLATIMASCAQVEKDAVGKNQEKQRYIYKLISNREESDTGSFKVVYHVQRYKFITQNKKDEPLDPKPGQFIEFDYMYTGKNIDVLEFDIKMDMGLSFFHTLAVTPSNPANQTSYVDGTQPQKITAGVTVDNNKTTEVSQGNTTKSKIVKTPLFMSTTVSDPFIRNTFDPIETASFDAALTRHASYEHIEATIKITGNPNLLDDLLDTTGDKTTQDIEEETDDTGAQNITRTPWLIKVNVRYPENNEVTKLKDFWFRGFYHMYSITQNFQEGLFTQDIQMLAIPQTDGSGLDQSTTPGRNANPEIKGTYAPNVGPLCTTEKFPYDIITGVKGSPHATPEFIEAVEKMCGNLGTRPEWMLAVMSFETGGTFSPSIKSALSSATGLIQFLDATAIEVGTTTAELAAMTATEQLFYVQEYFLRRAVDAGKPLTSLEAVYSTVLFGSPKTDPNEKVYFEPTANYEANKGLDFNDDGAISVGEATALVTSRLFGGLARIQRQVLTKGVVPDSRKVGFVSGDWSSAFTDAMYSYQGRNGLTVSGFINDETGRSLFGIEQLSDELCDVAAPVFGPKYPRNQRNNNPLNIRNNSIRWQGKLATSGSFVHFSDPKYGLRAAYIILRDSYYTKYKLRTLNDIIARWAPQEDQKEANAEINYINRVSAVIGIAPTVDLNLATNSDTLIALAKAMAVVEGGSEFEQYSDNVYSQALEMSK